MALNRRLMDVRQDPLMSSLSAGRTFDQQIDCIANTAHHGETNGLRNALLWGNGVSRIGVKAENVILTGCYGMFYYPNQIIAYLNSLDKLGVDYTLLEEEVCCGLPLLEMSDDSEEEKGIEASKRFTQENVDRVRQLEAKSATLFCAWCAHIYPEWMPKSDVPFQYFTDLLLSTIKEKKPRLKLSGRVGYYEGCHIRNKVYAPNVTLNWGGAKELLAQVEGLEVVELKNTCCVRGPEKVVQQIKDLELDTVVTSCISCQVRLAMASNGEYKSKFLSEIINEALD